VELEMGIARRFVKYNEAVRSLEILEGMTTEDDIGEYVVEIKLEESGLTSQYSFILKVLDLDSQTASPADGLNNTLGLGQGLEPGLGLGEDSSKAPDYVK